MFIQLQMYIHTVAYANLSIKLTVSLIRSSVLSFNVCTPHSLFFGPLRHLLSKLCTAPRPEDKSPFMADSHISYGMIEL